MPGLFKSKPKPPEEKPKAGDKPPEKGKPQAPGKFHEKGKPKADKPVEKGKPQVPARPPEKEKPKVADKPPDKEKPKAADKPARSSSLGQIYLGLLIFVVIIGIAYLYSLGHPTADSALSSLSVSATRTIVPEAILLSDFDSGIGSWQARGSVSPSEGRAGAGVMVTSAATGKSELWIDIPKNRFQAGKEYRALAWCNTTPKGICTITFMQSDDKGLYQENSVAGSNDWEQIAVQLVITADTQDMRIILDGNTAQKKADQRSDPPVYYDDVELTEVSE